MTPGGGSKVSPYYETALTAACQLPFLRGFLPPEDREEAKDYARYGPGLGLLLTRETADPLADADPPTADPWRRNTFALPPEGDGLGGVYRDVAHGALRFEPGGRQVRAPLARPSRWR